MGQNVEYQEKEVLLRVADGDEQAFRALFHQWLPFLSTHVFRITESREITEEIVQDIFLKIWIARESLTEIDNFKGYLIVVSKNHALNFLRKLAREKLQMSEWEKEGAMGSVIEDQASEIPYLTLIDEAIDNLPNRQREVYLLHRHERLTYQEIAVKLSVSRETVKTNLKLAVTSISKYLQSRMVFFLILWINQ